MHRAFISGTAGLLTGSALSLADFEYPVAARIGIAVGLGLYVYLLGTHGGIRRITRRWGIRMAYLRGSAVMSAFAVGVATWFIVIPRIEPPVGRLDPVESEQLAQRAAELTVSRMRGEKPPSGPVVEPAAVAPVPTPVVVPAPAPVTRPRVALRTELSLYLMYAYEWSNYLGATGQEGDMSRPIDADVPLRRSVAVAGAQPYRLDLGIINRSMYPSERISLRLIVPEGVTAVKGGRWVNQTDRTFTYDFISIDSRTGNHADYPLMLTFKQPGSYEFKYSVKAWGQDATMGTFTTVWEN